MIQPTSGGTLNCATRICTNTIGITSEYRLKIRCAPIRCAKSSSSLNEENKNFSFSKDSRKLLGLIEVEKVLVCCFLIESFWDRFHLSLFGSTMSKLFALQSSVRDFATSTAHCHFNRLIQLLPFLFTSDTA